MIKLVKYDMQNNKEISIFSIPLDSLKKEQLFFLLRKRIQERKQTSVATVNPEILLKARKNPTFSDTLKKCTILLVDGFGVLLVSFLKYQTKISRCVGREALDVFCSLAKNFKFTIGVIGGTLGVSGQAAKILNLQYPDVHFVDLSEGHEIRISDKGVVERGEEHIHDAVSKKKIGMVIVGFGAQKQESWMLHFMKDNPSCLGGIGVGGILDVLAGKIRKPPYLFSVLGLEWLWRLIMQPSRFTRILNAVIVFPFKAFFYD